MIGLGLRSNRAELTTSPSYRMSRFYRTSLVNSTNMHSSLVRLQNVFGFFTTVAFTVAGLVAISVVLNSQSPSAEIKLRNVQVSVSGLPLLLHSSHQAVANSFIYSVKGRPHYYSTKREEYAHIKFDLDAGSPPSLSHRAPEQKPAR